MSETYSAVCIQSNVASATRKDIRKKNLDRDLELINYAVNTVGFPKYAPTRLIAFPEYFMQGWIVLPSTPNHSVYERYIQEVALQIPGEETEILGKVAKKHNLYIAGTASEVIPEFPEFPLNCAFIIGPTGEVIYKQHKFCPLLAKVGRDAVSPHDVWDKYLKVMDGKYGRKKGDIVSCFFPVIETDIGKLGVLICNDGHYPEHARALGLQGCEVMLRLSGGPALKACPPQEMWDIENRSHAVFNNMYVVACASGWRYSGTQPTIHTAGRSLVVDYQGALIALADYPGETCTGAVIDLEILRKRRTDPKYNWLTQLRTEVYVEMYKKPIYPKNLFLNKPVAEISYAERSDAQPVERFLKERIFIPPGS